ncbi:MAG TPA: hypothetical protein P5267_00975 [Patescibacteria group bacterium]|nr:hypothetical protein [Patescibacteria group bacterium]
MLRKKILFLCSIIITGLILSGCSFSVAPKNQSTTPTITGGVYKSADKGLGWEAKNNFPDVGKARLNIKKISFGINSAKVIFASSNVGLYLTEDGADNWKLLIPNTDIADFVLNPKTKSIIYVASGNQVYKTSDTGAKWDLIYTEVRPNVTIKSLAVDYFDTSRIYLLENDGVLLISLDWGNSWKPLYNFAKPTSRILADPYHNKNLYAAVEGGLYRSVDSGATWQEIMADKRNDYPGVESFKDLSFVNQAGDLIYLSRYGLLRSFDSGETWTPLKLVSPPNSVDIEVFSYNPKEPDEIYYTLNDVLYHTIDGGRNWQTKVLPSSGKYKASGILVDPTDPNNLYLSLTQ